MKIDIHIHTVYSDGYGTVRDILKIAKFKGLDGIAITDHDTLKGYFKTKSYNNGNGLLVIPGYEVHTDAGHVIVLGLETLPPRTEHIRYEELIEWVRRLGGVTIIAHPAVGRIALERWLNCRPDAVEVLNALYPLHGYFTRRSMNIALKLNVPTVGGSDAHYPQNVGDAYTVIELNSLNLDDFISSFKSGRVYFYGGASPLSLRLRVGLGYIISMVRG